MTMTNNYRFLATAKVKTKFFLIKSFSLGRIYYFALIFLLWKGNHPFNVVTFFKVYSRVVWAQCSEDMSEFEHFLSPYYSKFAVKCG